MGSANFTEPASGSAMLTDTIGGAEVFQYRDTPFSAWADVDYAAVSSPGTAQVAASSTTCKGLWIVANPFNQEALAIGPHASTKATATLAGFRGIPVYPGMAFWVPVTNTNLVYVDAVGTDQYAVVYPTHTDS